MSLKMEFVERATTAGASVAELCREYGVSRETGHKWLRRFAAEGYGGLEERSRRPSSTPLAKAEDVVMSILEAREAHPSWGPRKLVVLLRRRFGAAGPSARTIARVLDRFGKLRKRRPRRELSVVERAPHIEARAPNEVWTIDFKGWWRTADGERFEPLTVRDSHSRFVLAARVLDRERGETVRDVLDELMRRYGVPQAIQCDNGAPFVAVHARAGLSALSAWWVSLGIRIVRSRPGCPQDNGAHERMHRDMSGELQSVPADTLTEQQRALDRWRQIFNHVRPHDALGSRTPADVYVASPTRPRVRIPVYPPGWLVRKVASSGEICVRSVGYFISSSLTGHLVGLESVDALHSRVWFHDLDLGFVELAPDDLSIARAHPLAGRS